MDEEFDTEIFTSEVRECPILWKSTLEEYHNRNKKQTAALMEITSHVS